MPRISVCLNYADSDDPHFSGEHWNFDYCRDCYPHVDADALAEARGLPPEAVDDAVEHPEYDSWDYTCEMCGCALGRRDD